MALHCKHIASSAFSIALETIGISNFYQFERYMNITHQDLKLPTLCNFFIYSSAMLLFNRAQVSLISFLCLGVVPPLPHKKASLGRLEWIIIMMIVINVDMEKVTSSSGIIHCIIIPALLQVTEEGQNNFVQPVS